MVTSSEAKKIIKTELDNRKIVYEKLTVKTIPWSNIIGDRIGNKTKMIFVEIHGLKQFESLNEIKRIAQNSEFRVNIV